MSHPVDSPRNHLLTLSVPLPSRFAVGWLNVWKNLGKTSVFAYNGLCWAIFVPSSLFGLSRRRLGAIWGRLGPILGPLGAILGPSWGHVWGLKRKPNRGKRPRKRKCLFTTEFVKPSSSHLRSLGHLGAVLGPSWGRIGAILGPSLRLHTSNYLQRDPN